LFFDNPAFRPRRLGGGRDAMAAGGTESGENPEQTRCCNQENALAADTGIE
jgi:hypothetical protein